MIAVMPMAGRGSRFSGSSFNAPKPLIRVNGVPMFVAALHSLEGINVSKLILISLEEHETTYRISELIKDLVPYPVELILLQDVTEGQLCTVLAAQKHLDTDEDILIVSSDTIIQSNLGNDIRQRASTCKGIISVADMPGDQWSFARTDNEGRVLAVTEKVRISNHASTGMYYFSNGREFCSMANKIIENQEKTRGEYYVIPVYQKFIDRGELITLSHASRMWDLGTPESLTSYLNTVKQDKTN